MQKLLLSLLVIICFLSSCSQYNPEGIWQNDEVTSQRILILKNEENISVRFPGSRKWVNFKDVGSNDYMSKATQNELKFVSADKLEYTNQARGKATTFTKIILEEANPDVISMQMTREQVRQFIGAPKEQYTEKLAEKWVYENGLTLTFDDTGVFKMDRK